MFRAPKSQRHWWTVLPTSLLELEECVPLVLRATLETKGRARNRHGCKTPCGCFSDASWRGDQTPRQCEPQARSRVHCMPTQALQAKVAMLGVVSVPLFCWIRGESITIAVCFLSRVFSKWRMSLLTFQESATCQEEPQEHHLKIPWKVGWGMVPTQRNGFNPVMPLCGAQVFERLSVL